MKRTLIAALSMAFCLSPVLAFADPDDPSKKDHDPEEKKALYEGENMKPASELPPSESDDDPKPPVAAPMVPPGGVVEQAGVGGNTAYGRGGVLEFGGSASFARATDFTALSIAPSIGYFFMDDLEISGILGLTHVAAQGTNTTFFSVLAEPSVHLPFSDTLFGFMGLGMGLSYADEPGAGFALAPRLGLNVMVGRSGILTPAIYAQYSTHEAIETPMGTMLAVQFAYGMNLGYTVMW